MNWDNFKRFTYKDIPNLYLPLFAGSAVLGLACAALFYFLTFWFIKRRHARKAAKKHRAIHHHS